MCDFTHLREFPMWVPMLRRSFPMLKGSFFKTGIVSSVAKSDEISKIAHLAFSPEIMGADILEKLSLTTEKSLFVSTKESPHAVPHAVPP